MTTIRHICCELSDISAVLLECASCHATISFPLLEWRPKILNCPNCAANLMARDSRQLLALGQFAESLKQLLEYDKDPEAKFRLCLELLPDQADPTK